MTHPFSNNSRLKNAVDASRAEQPLKAVLRCEATLTEPELKCLHNEGQSQEVIDKLRSDLLEDLVIINTIQDDIFCLNGDVMMESLCKESKKPREKSPDILYWKSEDNRFYLAECKFKVLPKSTLFNEWRRFKPKVKGKFDNLTSLLSNEGHACAENYFIIVSAKSFPVLLREFRQLIRINKGLCYALVDTNGFLEKLGLTV